LWSLATNAAGAGAASEHPAPSWRPGIYAISQSFLRFSMAAALTAIIVIWLVQKMHSC
jgi:hypothetical protein